MTRDVLIMINGSHFSDGENEDVNMAADGEYYLKNGKHYIRYEETGESPDEVIKNTIRISPDSVDIIRNGQISTHMAFKKNEKNISGYDTLFGEILIGIYTNDIEITEMEDLIEVSLDYSLDIDDEHISDNSISLSVIPREQ